MSLLPVQQQFPQLIEKCKPIVQTLHDTFASSNTNSNTSEMSSTWSRMKRKLPKEINESAFILQEMIELLDQYEEGEDEKDLQPITFIDICSGVGFISIFLSHLLPKQKVSRIVPIDVLFHPHIDPSTTKSDTDKQAQEEGTTHQQPHIPSTQTPSPKQKKINHRLSTQHLRSSIHPIPIHPRQANIKKGRELRQIARFCINAAPGPIVILGVHLCKSLSVHTVRLFNMTVDKSFKLYLKPCCLPGRRDLRRKDPPFWTFDHMDDGGFGSKTLYCEEITKDNHDEVEEILHDRNDDDHGEGEDETIMNNKKHRINVNNRQHNGLFSKWTNLLCQAVNTNDGTAACIQHYSTQSHHFQNQFIVASR